MFDQSNISQTKAPPLTLAYQAAYALSTALFLGYGAYYLLSDAADAEFERFKLPGLRRLTGALQVLGALGLLVGAWVPALVTISAGGLSLMMALALATRARIRDPLSASVPALVLMLMTLFVAVSSLQRLE